MEHIGDNQKDSYDLRDPVAFRLLFEQFYEPLCNYALFFLHAKPAAEDLIQALFMELWEKRARMMLPIEPRFFLLRATKNRAIDQLRQQKKASKLMGALSNSQSDIEDNPADANQDQVAVLSEFLPFAISQLPPKTKAVFLMSRQEEKSYKEIAASLEISVKTVENQMSRAFRLLRTFFDEKKNQK